MGGFSAQKLNGCRKNNLNCYLCCYLFRRKEGEQPDKHKYSKRDRKNVDSKMFSTKQYLRNLKQLFKKDYMNESSGLLLNYGHPFVQNIGFRQYRSFIDRAVRIVKEKYKGKAVWRTMASNWRESKLPEDYFKNHQVRTSIFLLRIYQYVHVRYLSYCGN